MDQAEGLRRLLAGPGARIVAVVGGPAGVGCTSTVVNLAAALTALGKDVLVVDERANVRSAAATLCGAWLRDGESVRVGAGFSVYAAGRRGRTDADDAQLLALADEAIDIVLVDAQRDEHGGLSPLARHAHDVIVVTRVAAQAITDAYACMKRLHYAHAIAQFRMLINHVGSHADAKTTFDNLAGVAGRYLAVSLGGAGHVCADPLVDHARSLARTAVDAFPSSPAARDYRKIAADLLYWPRRPDTWRAGASARADAGAGASAGARTGLGAGAGIGTGVGGGGAASLGASAARTALDAQAA